MNIYEFLSFWIINSVVFYTASTVWPNDVVVGNRYLPAVPAAVFAAFVLTFIVEVFQNLLSRRKIKLKSGFQNKLASLVLNTASVWLTARGGPIVGLGITSWRVAVVLGVILTLLQWVVLRLSASKSR